jgi:hypothetical protein
LHLRLGDDVDRALHAGLVVAVDQAGEFEVAGALAKELFPALKEARPKWKWTLRGDTLHETPTFEER